MILVEFHMEMDDPAPLSVNHLYGTRGPRRFLTKEGAHFKGALTAAIVHATFAHEWSKCVDYVYLSGAWVHLTITLCMTSIHNKSWKGGSMTRPKRRPDGTYPKARRRSPYQKLDATNYIKLIEDAVAAGTGIDDSAHLVVAVEKREDKEHPRIIIDYRIHE